MKFMIIRFDRHLDIGLRTAIVTLCYATLSRDVGGSHALGAIASQRSQGKRCVIYQDGDDNSHQ